MLAQLIRRGGIRSGPIIQPGQVDGRIAQLRAQAKSESDEKVEEGMRQKQGWLPPDEYEGVQYTQLEDELRELTRGPDESWLKDVSGGGGSRVWDKRVEHPNAMKRLEELKNLESEGIFKGMEKWSHYLQSHVRSRVLNSKLDGTSIGVEEALLEATEKGCRELAEEAERALADGRMVGRSGDDECKAWVGQPLWNREKGYGIGKVDFTCCGETYTWKFVDYKDKLPVPQEIASALGLEPGEEEERQCLVLHPCAGYMVWEGNYDVENLPTLKEVQNQAQKFRATLWDQAASAIGELGDPAPWIGSREADLRNFAHDCLRPHHDKDYRMFQAYLVEELKGYTMQCWRVNCRDQYKVDYLIGSGPRAESNVIPFLIHGGHIRLLLPPDRNDGLKLAAAMTMRGIGDSEFQCQGWREYLAQEDEAAPLAPGKRSKCPRCCDGGGKLGKVLPNVPWSFQEHPIDTQELILLGAQQPLCKRPSFAYGIRVQEVFAGSGTWTEAMKEAGLEANTPIELYEDPMRKLKPRPEFDLKRAEVAEQLKAEAGALPGPETANVWEFGTPCTSYCDFNRVSGGSRTYSRPEGNNPTPTEVDGNYFCELTCELGQLLYNIDKEFVLESSMPSGRYPKIWDQPAAQRLQEATGALIVPTHLCEWGAAPDDQPALRYKKGQWNLVTPGLYVYALLLARRCSGSHKHLEVRGPSSQPGVPRTREAQVYPIKLCRAAGLPGFSNFGWPEGNCRPPPRFCPRSTLWKLWELWGKAWGKFQSHWRDRDGAGGRRRATSDAWSRSGHRRRCHAATTPTSSWWRDARQFLWMAEARAPTRSRLRGLLGGDVLGRMPSETPCRCQDNNVWQCGSRFRILSSGSYSTEKWTPLLDETWRRWRSPSRRPRRLEGRVPTSSCWCWSSWARTRSLDWPHPVLLHGGCQWGGDQCATWASTC